MPIKEKLTLRVEDIEKQNKELFLQYKKLEQEFEKVRPETLGNVKNDFWYKYRSEVHKIFSNINNTIKKINDFSFWSVFISLIFILQVVKYTNNFTYIIILTILLFGILSIFIYPFIAVFFQLKIYLQLKNSKNCRKILIPTGKFLYRSLTTFVIVISFPPSLYFLIKIIILNNIGNNIRDLDFKELKIVIDSVMQGKDLSVIIYVFILGIPFLTYEASRVLIKSYLQTLNNKWKNYKPVAVISCGSILLFSFCIIFSFTGEIPAFIKELEEELRKNDMGYATKFVSDILVAYYQYYLIIGAFILHSMGLLVSEYFVDKQYIEKHNILPLH